MMKPKENSINHQKSHARDKEYAMLQWLNRNRRRLLADYKNQYIAYNANGLIAHSENLQEVLA